MVACVVGTRPEAIKTATVVAALRALPGLETRLISTGQHAALLSRALDDFGLAPDVDLALMRPGQEPADVLARGVVAVSDYLRSAPADLVIAQGDTTTVLATALACHYLRTPFAHLEAGLRTGRAYDPFPEEKHRVLADHLADRLYAPTALARRNLVREGIAADSIRVAGNTVVDALKSIAARNPRLPFEPPTPRFILATTHRRENLGAPLERICRALRTLLERDPTLALVLPTHPNPDVRATVEALLAGRPRVLLVEPPAYPAFVALMRAAALVVTDSGGVQEEAPALGAALVIVRETTERPEALAAPLVRLSGTDVDTIVRDAEALLALRDGSNPSPTTSPFGDGHASLRVARDVAARFGLAIPPLPPGVPAEWDAASDNAV